MSDLGDARGVLFPDALPTFHRRSVPADVGAFARWYWIAQWELPDGQVSTQEVLPFPAANLVVEPTGTALSGPTTSASHRELSGTGWAFGVLLRPAGLHLLGYDPRDLVDTERSVSLDELAAGVGARMVAGDPAAAAEVMSAWWRRRAAGSPEPIPHGATSAARMLEIVEGDRGIVGVGQLADEMGMSTRALQRLAARYIGLSPLRVIRRYRLQEAALRLREDPELSVADVAAELGYADQSHLAADFRTTLGFTARDYRRQRQP